MNQSIKSMMNMDAYEEEEEDCCCLVVVNSCPSIFIIIMIFDGMMH